MNENPRDLLMARLREDLVGPLRADEVLEDRPSDRYLTGLLFPRRARLAAEEDEELRAGGPEEEDSTDAAPEAVSLSHVLRPATAGLSFAVRSSPGKPPVILAHVRCGTYEPFWTDEKGNILDEPGPDYAAKWRRTEHCFTVPDIALESGAMSPIDLERWGTKGLQLHVQVTEGPDCFLVTAVLVNTWSAADSRLENEKRTFFQVELRITAAEGTELVARPSRRGGEEPEYRLIYRSCREYATGHTCSARWSVAPDGSVQEVGTEWLPSQLVPAVSADGAQCFMPLRQHPSLKPFSATWLSKASAEDIAAALGMVPDAYSDWLDEQEQRVAELPEDLRPQAREHLAACRRARDRMREAVGMLKYNEAACSAFKCAQRAMVIQRRWTTEGAEDDLVWRPFQIAFQMLTLPSLIRREHPDRHVMDLLWFPTGGGKTEAYLALVALVLFWRRLTGSRSRGTAAIMRYTLRLLTIQQFQRAAALICACEHLRRGCELPDDVRDAFGDRPFSIGLWVGGGATPNSVRDAAGRLGVDEDPTPCQIKVCPACRRESLHWSCGHPPGSAPSDPDRILVRCTNGACPFGGSEIPFLPIWTVDEDIYREGPSLLIATVDKFAQIARKPAETSVFFGRDGDPPDLIIQDELHLVSGPLGTIAALYETAIDALCSRTIGTDQGNIRVIPKVIGSTATIRRASEQIGALFARKAFQFPPPVLDAEDSCFAVRDENSPGRLYVGVTSAGRSPKFTLQAVCASLLQGASSPTLEDDRRDPWWTLLVYFNSLRELGGALVMMQDDVPASIALYARLRGEEPRQVRAIDELTSRKRQVELRDTLHQLEKVHGTGEAYDAVLATNMISVGVDVPRLSLMVVHGQPKQIAEYIQATSRVGRRHPGLIVTAYNAGRARDRSHYETFASWHTAPYRDVEATSVTPFASRAQDKAVHAVLVALVRHLMPRLRDVPLLGPDARREVEAVVVPLIIERCRSVDPDERHALEGKIRELLDAWETRTQRWLAAGITPKYWWDHKPDRSLLMSAEHYAARKAAGWLAAEVWPMPNSMRDVEPGTPFMLLTRIRTGESESAS